MTPQYDTHPFEFICEEKIDGVWEDVSNVKGGHKITYSPTSTSSIYDSTNE